MFERDKTDLRDMGFPVETVESLGGTGYRIPAREALLQDPGFTPDERAALALAALAWGSGRDPSAASFGMLKLSAVGGERPDVTPGWFLPRVSMDADVPRLLAAIKRRKRVGFRYRTGGGGAPQERTVEPHGLSHRGSWYLSGFDVERDAVRHFKLARVDGAIRVAPGKEPDFDPPARHPGEPRAPWEGEGVQARIAFAPQAVWQVLHRAGARQVGDRGGLVEVSLPVSDVGSFASWVAGFGPDARVLSPDELRAAVIAHLRAALEES
jgi:proteasome accessory factor B